MTTQPTPPDSGRAGVVQGLRQVLTAFQDYPALARAMTDPAASADMKQQLLGNVFAAVGKDAAPVLAQVVNQPWETTAALVEWLETTTVGQAWAWADADGTLLRSIDEVFAFGQLMIRDHGVRAAATDRNVPLERRQEFVSTLLADHLTQPSLEVVLIAVAAGRGTIDDALGAYLKIGAQMAGAQLAAVTVARPMPAEQKQRLGTALESKLKTKIIVEEVVDPAVLGGVRVECGAEVIDSTLASRLAAVRRDFS